MNKSQAWLLAARPKTLPAALAPVMLSQAMAFAAGQASLLLALAIAVCALGLQIAVNLANDLFDFQRGVDGGDRLGPARAAQSGWLSAAELRAGLLLVLLLTVGTGLWLVMLGGWPFFWLGVASVLALLAYSGGPLPLASCGLGEVAVFLFFGLLAVAGSYYLQAHELPAAVWLAAVQMGCLTAAIMLVNNIRDRESDRRAGRFTLAIALGERGSRVLYSLLLLFAFALLPLQALTWLAIFPCLALIWRIFHRSGEVLNRQLAQTALLCLLFALLRSADFII